MHREIVLILNMKIYFGFEMSNVPSSGFSVALRNFFEGKTTSNLNYPVLSHFPLLYSTVITEICMPDSYNSFTGTYKKFKCRKILPTSFKHKNLEKILTTNYNVTLIYLLNFSNLFKCLVMTKYCICRVSHRSFYFYYFFLF